MVPLDCNGLPCYLKRSHAGFAERMQDPCMRDGWAQS